MPLSKFVDVYVRQSGSHYRSLSLSFLLYEAASEDSGRPFCNTQVRSPTIICGGELQYLWQLREVVGPVEKRGSELVPNSTRPHCEGGANKRVMRCILMERVAQQFLEEPRDHDRSQVSSRDATERN